MWTAQFKQLGRRGTIQPYDKFAIDINFINSEAPTKNFSKTYEISIGDLVDENDIKQLIINDIDLLEKADNLETKLRAILTYDKPTK